MQLVQLLVFTIGLFVAALFSLSGHGSAAILGMLAVFWVANSLMQRRQAACFVTLSVPELLMDVMDAFKLELFPLTGWSTDFSSKTAVKGDVITAHISTLPAAADYDATTGFDNGVQNAEDLLTDIPVTLDTFKHVPVRIKYLSQLQSKMPLYREAVRNTGYVLAKLVIDTALGKAIAANFSHSKTIAAANFSLDSMTSIRDQLNSQKAYGRGRFGIVNTAIASALENDDRTKSALFYGQMNGDEGYRVFRNMSGFRQIMEYPDFPANSINLAGIFGDPRAFAIATRQVDFGNVAAELGAPKIMEFIPLTDPTTGLTMTAVIYQKAGTGDVYFSPAILFGIGAGKQGGTADTITDKAAVLLKTQ